MKYVQPYGITDPDGPYINGDPSIGRMGSIPPAAAFEHPMRELVQVINGSQLTPDENDLKQVMKGIRSQRMNYAQDTGSINALSVAFDPPLSAYTIGLPIRVKVANTNTGAASINAGAGVVQIKKPNGSQVGAGDLNAGGLVDLVYDGTAFQMINFGGTGTGGGGSTFVVNVPYIVDTGTANNVIANFSPALTSIVAGTLVMVKMANTNTTATTMNVNGLGARPVLASGGAGGALIHSDIQAGVVYLMRYDGTQWWIDPSPNITGNVTFTIANNAQFDAIFVTLSRKRINSNVTVTIKLGIGVFNRMESYHVDADRIRVEGTMLGAVPGTGDFAKSGNTPAQRAQDSSNNLAMLRSRYGTEIHYTNAGGAAFVHHGPGRIIISSILITGENTLPPAGASNTAIGPDPGGAMYCEYVSLWGCHSFGFGAHGSTITCWQCHSCSGQGYGFVATSGGSLAMHYSGCFGSEASGCHALNGAAIWLMTSCDMRCHASFGCFASNLSQITVSGQSIVQTNNVDLYANYMGMISIQSGSAAVTFSPAANTVGNYNAFIAQL